jgi:IstB-like ATP binding protein
VFSDSKKNDAETGCLRECTGPPTVRSERIGRFKAIADFDWNWPKKIDREVIEHWLGLDPIAEGRKLILLGSDGVGKTPIAKNAAYQ